MVVVGRRNYDQDRKILSTLIVSSARRAASKLENEDAPNSKLEANSFYAQQITKLANRESDTFLFYMSDLKQHDENLFQAVVNNTHRYISIINDILDEMISEVRPTLPVVKDTLDIFIQHRLLIENNTQKESQSASKTGNFQTNYPPELLRRYEVRLVPCEEINPQLIRNIKADSIGHFIRLKAVVIKQTEVKPLMKVATYTCDVCACETYQIVSSVSFTPIMKCKSEECLAGKAGGHLQLQIRGSKMVKFQEIKIQELSSEVPTGSIPRSLTVYLTGEMCRTVKPGDHVMASGIIFPTSSDIMSRLALGKSGRHGGGALSCDTYLQTHHLKILNKMDGFESNLGVLTDDELSAIHEDNFYEKLACSIAPEIYGNMDLKKAILLLLIGGTAREVDHMQIRGDIHMCLMGDPGVAKSQLLSFASRLSHRSQNVSGKGSSGVGLTASVIKDDLTGEVSLQGGALVLSDGGICCIDEFDKMSEHDRTAIHEVMEQQTVSIAKAGINATLNARTSILAAANPAYGRYNLKKSLTANINLPSALLSRFDLLWLLRDYSEKENDLRLAKHILYVHQNSAHPKLEFKPINANLMKKYIAYAKLKEPLIPDNLKALIIEKYVSIRKEMRALKNSTFISARALLSILRLSTALAKLRLSNEVTKEDITEAFRLTEASQESLSFALDEEEMKSMKRKGYRNPIQKIFQIIKELFEDSQNRESSEASKINLKELYERCVLLGFNKEQIDSCIKEYSDLNILMIDTKTSSLMLI